MSEAARASPLSIAAALGSVYVIWGSTYLAIRFAIETLPGFTMAGARWLLAGGALYAWMRLRGAPRPEARHWRSAILIGALLIVGGNGTVVWAESRIPSGLAALVIATVPLWIVLLDWARSGTRPGGRVAIGLGLGFTGVGFLVGPAILSGGGTLDLLGVGSLVAAAMLWAFGSLYSRKAALPPSPLLGAAMEMIAGGVLLTLLGGATGEFPRIDLAGVSLRSGLSLAYLVVFGSIIGYSSYVWLLGVTTPSRATTYAFVNPIVAVLLGWGLADERLDGASLVAAAFIVVSVALIVTAPGKPAQAPEAPPAGASRPEGSGARD